MSTDKVHARLGASSAERWIACPGSINLSEGLPTFSTPHSREGTAAHNLAELSLRTGSDPFEHIGKAMPDGEGEWIIVTEEMAAAVQAFTDWINLRWTDRAPDAYGIEEQFDLAPLGPPEPMFGTTDHWAYDAETRTLYIDDYKHGQGVVKEAIENEQLMYYGIGGLLALAERGDYPVDTVVLTIVQPRAHHPAGPVRSWSTTPAELLDFVGVLFEAARATQEPDAPLVPGEHCRFCPAAGVCPAKRAEAQALAQIEFETLPEYGPPRPETLPVEVLGDMASKFHILRDWMKQAEGLIEAKLRAGEEVPGFKLVERRKTRSWVPEAEAALQDMGLVEEELYDRRLKSPAQVEKVVGKRNLPKELVVSKASGYTLAKESDPRPGVALSPATEFLALQAGPDPEE